jgi:hypothetical protein
MIKLNTTSYITEAEFDRLYADSVNDMNNGSMPWESIPFANTEEKKKAYIKSLFDVTRDSNHLISIRDGDYLIALFLGQWHGSELIITSVLVSPDASGSKAWTYSEEYALARNSYWSEARITGWTHRSANVDSQTYLYLMSCIESNVLNCLYEIKEVPAPVIPPEYSEHFTNLNKPMVDVVLYLEQLPPHSFSTRD